MNVHMMLFTIMCLFNTAATKTCSTEERQETQCFPEERIQKTFDNLVFQYTDPPVAFEEYCRRVWDDWRIWQSYTNSCNMTRLHKVLNYVTVGYQRVLNTRCPIAQKRSSIQLKAYRRVIGCMDRLVNAMYYNLRNVPAKDQTNVYCCVRDDWKKCTRREVTEIWGKINGDFLANAMFEPLQMYHDNVCINSQVCRIYHAEINVMKKLIVNSELTNRTLGFVFYKFNANTVQSECYKEE